jgi:rubredoxin
MVNKQKSWKCSVCGEIINGDFPPDDCPVCGVSSDKFIEVTKDDSPYHNDTKEHFIIIGGGPAGTIAADEIRKRNSTAHIEIISKEDVIGYNRPMLTKGIMRAIDMKGFFI